MYDKKWLANVMLLTIFVFLSLSQTSLVHFKQQKPLLLQELPFYCVAQIGGVSPSPYS